MRVARVETDQPFGGQAQLQGMVADRLGQHEDRAGEAASRPGSVPGSRWSECLWLASTRSTPRSSLPRIGARVMRTCGRSVASYFLVRCSER